MELLIIMGKGDLRKIYITERGRIVSMNLKNKVNWWLLLPILIVIIVCSICLLAYGEKKFFNVKIIEFIEMNSIVGGLVSLFMSVVIIANVDSLTKKIKNTLDFEKYQKELNKRNLNTFFLDVDVFNNNYSILNVALENYLLKSINPDLKDKESLVECIKFIKKEQYFIAYLRKNNENLSETSNVNLTYKDVVQLKRLIEKKVIMEWSDKGKKRKCNKLIELLHKYELGINALVDKENLRIKQEKVEADVVEVARDADEEVNTLSENSKIERTRVQASPKEPKFE